MKLDRTERFKKAYKALTKDDQERTQKAMRLLVENQRHPSLRVKKLKGVKGIWEARVTQAVRMTFEISKDVIWLRNVGAHDPTLKNP